MKNMKFNLLKNFLVPLLVLSLTAIFIPVQAMAATTYAEALATLNAFSFSISYSATGSITSDQTALYAAANDVIDSTTTGISVSAKSDDDSVTASGEWSEWIRYSSVTNTLADSLAKTKIGYYGTYTAETAGTFTISYTYNLGYRINAQAGEYASALSLAAIEIGDESAMDSIGASAFNGESSYVENDNYKTLVLNYDLEAGESISFAAYTFIQADTSAPVPVPGAFVLLGTGLLGLAGTMRKRRY